MILSPTLAQIEDETQVSLLAENPKAHVIWLHGLGASGYDFVDVAKSLNLKHPISFYFPHAPMQPVTLNQGFVMPAWYDIYDISEGAKQDEIGIERSAKYLDKYIDKICQAQSGPIIIGGFSQGGALAIYHGLTRDRAIANFVLSGYLPVSEQLPLSKNTRQERPIFLSHGAFDTVLPISLSKKSYEALSGFHQIEWHEYPMEHQVSDQQLLDLSKWLDQVLASYMKI